MRNSHHELYILVALWIIAGVVTGFALGNTTEAWIWTAIIMAASALGCGIMVLSCIDLMDR